MDPVLFSFEQKKQRMAIDQYSPCPCGSGKKFKWCCQPISAQIDKAMRLDAEGQHDVALRHMEELRAEHASNPEVWGRYAQLLYNNQKVEEAEAALEKAFAINPRYPFGYLLRGIFRMQEGEVAGALLLFRKAAEYFDPDARGFLGQVHASIFECEMKMNRPQAALAALKTAIHLIPDDELVKAKEGIFGAESQLPESARSEYQFKSPPASISSERRKLWDETLSKLSDARLTTAAAAFESLTASDPEDLAAWYNLGLVRAWLGDNQKAIEALEEYVTREPDEASAVAAWTLVEVLRFGRGMEDSADFLSHNTVCHIRDPQSLFNFLNTWQQEGRLVAVQVEEKQGVVHGIVLDKQGGLVQAGGASTQPASLAAYFIIMGAATLRLWGTNASALSRAFQELAQRAGPSLGEGRHGRSPAGFNDVVSEAIVFPPHALDEESARRMVQEGFQRFYEDKWIHQPLKSLKGSAPVDAAGHPVLRKKLLGVIKLLEECASHYAAQPYEFDRLRRKLGLLQTDAPATSTPAEAPADLSSLSTAELAVLNVDQLSNDQLDQAHRAALKLDAQELASHFAQNLLARPAQSGQRDRYAPHNYLVQRSLKEGNLDAALDLVDQGEKFDCEHNEGRRRNDYELRRGQVLTRRGEFDAARDTFERLIGRVPAETRYRATAAEAMLSARQGPSALKFAEEGLAKAREKNDRDSEQHFMELVQAARKQVG